MQQAVRMIVERSTEFPQFRYYIRLIKKAERNITSHPDVCVETCKSLLEGVAKTIILALDSQKTRADLDTRKWRVDKLVKEAAKHMKQLDNIIEDDFVTRCASFAYALRELRNERGDISHGKAVPKTKASCNNLAEISLKTTDGILCYMLTEFFRIMDAKKTTPVAVEQLPEPLKYKDNESFNDWLDEQHPPQGIVLHSRALFECYHEDYKDQLAIFRNPDQEAAD